MTDWLTNEGINQSITNKQNTKFDNHSIITLFRRRYSSSCGDRLREDSLTTKTAKILVLTLHT